MENCNEEINDNHRVNLTLSVLTTIHRVTLTNLTINDFRFTNFTIYEFNDLQT